ncbi:MAG TPA: phosphate ABC transporter substrate-binding/OmpA family protein [Xanthobacteraceae bacterium]
MTSAAPLEWLISPATIETGIDRKVLAGLLLELARNVDANVGMEPTGIVPFDPRLEQLRFLLLGREIELSRHFSRVLDDPEQLAMAVARVLPAAIAQAAAHDERLGQVLAPALGSSVRRDPNTLVDILHPLIGPAIGKSIDAKFQRLNESLKYSLSWRGLKWRWEAWRTGTSFAEIVLKYTLVYRVEHVFLIHRHTGLLIAHAASQEATTQDPQLVSSMLSAIQDFVRDSFAEQQALDSLRLGELRVWSEPGPFATFVAVIRGNPPEQLRETFRDALARMHAERPEALEHFNGDSTGFADIEAALTDCVQLKQEKSRSAQKSFAWALIGALAAVLIAWAGIWGYQRWHDGRLWDSFLTRLRAQPGIVITATGESGGKWLVAGMRDPLAVDPQLLLQQSAIDPSRVVSQWQPYQSLEPQFVLKRAQEALAPPSTVSLGIANDRIVAAGTAPSTWMERARSASGMLPAGLSDIDLSKMRDLDEHDDRLWAAYVARLRAEPGIAVTDISKRDDASGAGRRQWLISGLRDPLAADPEQLLQELGIDRSRVVSQWQPYQSLDPRFVLKRAQQALAPPPTVTLAIEGNRIVAVGSAPSSWLARVGASNQILPAGVSHVDLTQVRNLDANDEKLWASYVARLKAEPGIAITEVGQRDGKWLIRGLRDPLAIDPQEALREAAIDPARVVAYWQPYQSLQPEFMLKRVQAAFAPPPTVAFTLQGDRIVATGSAALTWIQRARASSRLLPAGAPSVDLSQVRDINDGVLGKLRDAIQSREIHFDYGNPLPARGQESVLDELATDLKELTALSSTLRVTTRVTLTGHSDSTGQGLYNLALSLGRAESVRTLLKQRGVDPDLLAVRSAGTLEPRDQGNTEVARSVNRRVSFTVGIDE